MASAIEEQADQDTTKLAKLPEELLLLLANLLQVPKVCARDEEDLGELSTLSSALHHH